MFQISRFTNKYFYKNIRCKSLLALPFNINETKANEIINDNISMFESESKGKIMKCYIPFISVDIKNLKSSYIGNYTVSNNENANWLKCKGRIPSTNIPFGTKSMQFYADFKYPKDHIESALRSNHVVNINTIHISKDIKIDNHTMKEEYALEKINSKLYELEKQRIIQHIKRINNAQHANVTHIDMELDKADIKLKKYHVPAYLYSFKSDKNTLHKIISGSDGNIDGNIIYDSNKIGLVGGLTGILFGAAWVIGGPVTAVTTTLARTLIPAAVIGSMSKFVSKDSAKAENQKNNEAIINERKKYEDFNTCQSHKKQHTQCPHEEEKMNKKFERKFNKSYQSSNKRTKTEEEYVNSYFNGNYDYSYSSKHSSWGKQKTWHRETRRSAQYIDKETIDNLRLLGINYTENVNMEIIKKSYFKVIKKWHPDVYQGEPSIGRKMSRQINVAYDNLKKVFK